MRIIRVGGPLNVCLWSTGGTISNIKLHGSLVSRANADGLASEAFLRKCNGHSVHVQGHVLSFLLSLGGTATTAV